VRLDDAQLAQQRGDRTARGDFARLAIDVDRHGGL
jgi:hypothetical protein